MSSSELDYTKLLCLIRKSKRLFVVTALFLMTVAVIVSYLLPKKYEATSTVFIEKNVINDLVKGIAATPSIEDSIKVLTYALNSRTLVVKVINALDLNVKAKSDAEMEELIKRFQLNTEIKVKDKENLFTISFKHDNPRIARDYVNTLVRSYIEENVSSKRAESFGATNFLSEQIATYKEKLAKAEAAVIDFKRQKGGVINLDEGRLLQEINIAQQKLYDLQHKRRLLEGQLRASQKSADPLLTNLQALKKKLDELRVEYTDNYPEVLKVKADIESLQEQINARKGTSFSLDSQDVQNVETELSAIKSSEISLQRYIAANQSLLNNAPTAKAALEKLEAEKGNQKNMYDQLFARRDQSEVSKQMELQDKSATFRIVDPAVMPIRPISPDRIKIILIGMAMGLAGGLGVLMLRDNLDRSVKEVYTLKALNVPVLAVIPLMKSEEDIRLERRRDARLYIMGGLYFSLIVAVLVLETLTRFYPQLAAKLPGWM